MQYVLGQLSSTEQKITTYSSGVVSQFKVGVVTTLPGLHDLAKRFRFAKMVSLQLVLEGLVGSLGEHALLLQDGQNTHGLK